MGLWGKYRSQAVPFMQGYVQSRQGPRPAASLAGPSPCIFLLRKQTHSVGSPPLAPFGLVNFRLRYQVFVFISPKDLQIWNLLSLDGKRVGNLTQWIFLKVWMLPTFDSAGNTTRASFLIMSHFLVQLTQRNTQACAN